VQGVGFRYHASYAAQRYGVTGWVKNLYDGRVELEVQGTEETIDLMFASIEAQRFVEIRDREVRSLPTDPHEYEFKIRY
jgi:acylphosphatase